MFDFFGCSFIDNSANIGYHFYMGTTQIKLEHTSVTANVADVNEAGSLDHGDWLYEIVVAAVEMILKGGENLNTLAEFEEILTSCPLFTAFITIPNYLDLIVGDADLDDYVVNGDISNYIDISNLRCEAPNLFEMV